MSWSVAVPTGRRLRPAQGRTRNPAPNPHTGCDFVPFLGDMQRPLRPQSRPSTPNKSKSSSASSLTRKAVSRRAQRETNPPKQDGPCRAEREALSRGACEAEPRRPRAGQAGCEATDAGRGAAHAGRAVANAGRTAAGTRRVNPRPYTPPGPQSARPAPHRLSPICGTFA